MVSGPLDRRLLRQLPVVRWTIAASVAVGLVSAATVVVQALALASLLAGAMAGARPSDRAAAFAWLGGAVALRGVCAFGGELLARTGSTWTKGQLRRRLLGAALRQAPAGSGGSPAEVATVAGRGLDALDVYVGRCLPDLVLAAVAPLALVVAVGALDWVSAIVIAAALCLFPLFGALVGRANATLAGQRWRQVERLGRQIVDVFEGMAVLKAFGRSRQQRARIEQAGEALRKASLRTLRVAFLSALVLDELASISVALVAVPLGLRLLNGTVSLAAALAVLIVAPEVFLPLRRASAEFHQSAEGLAAVGSVMDLIGDAGGEGRERGVGAPGPPDPGRVPVELCSVHLAVPGRPRPILDGVELTIHPAETVVMVGANGAGKSTILSLLLAFSAPTSGVLRVGGLDLGSLDHEAWRKRIAYLPEHPSLLDGTLADNLRLADPAAGDEQLVAALAAAGAPELLDQLDEGLSTRIGEGGRPVSAGERQRIGLARIMLRPASLYLLDEPTVHLDVDTEAVVVEQLRRTLAGHSALIVTHRSAVLTLADRVVTLADGRLAAMNGGPGGVRTRSLPTQRVGPGAPGVPEVLGVRR